MLEDDCHKGTIGAKVNACGLVLWTGHVLHRLVNKVPEGQSEFEVRDCEDVSARGSPPTMGHSSKAFIHFAVPGCVINILRNGETALLYADQDKV